jgi:hypothetical protein
MMLCVCLLLCHAAGKKNMACSSLIPMQCMLVSDFVSGILCVIQCLGHYLLIRKRSRYATLLSQLLHSFSGRLCPLALLSLPT